MTSAGRSQLYVLLNLAFAVAVITAGSLSELREPRILYLSALMALCSTPLLWVEQLNGRYTLLSVFLAAYFFFYGVNDTVAMFDGRLVTNSQGLLSGPEFAVLLGAALAIVGYRVSARLPQRERRPARDWPMSSIVTIGAAFWCAGTATDWYWQLNFTSIQSFEGRGAPTMMALVMARLLQPLGTIMLGYALVTTRHRGLLLLVLGFMAIQIVVGFIGNSKETAMRGLIILMLSAYLVRGRVPKAWIAVGLAFVVLAFPIFQAYRAEVIGMRGMTRIAASQDISRAFALALSAKDKVQNDYSEDYRAPSFIERAALKPTIEMFMAGTGDTAQFQRGYTLSLYFTSFVPRLFWPDKPDASVGKLVNREFRVSEDPNTYISATYLGELYWNFGWPGIVAGMFAFGLLLGFINARCDLSEKRTLTRLLILITAIYATIVRFEGSIALGYIGFTRALIIIAVLHYLLARRPVTEPVRAGKRADIPTPAIHAPQLLR